MGYTRLHNLHVGHVILSRPERNAANKAMKIWIGIGITALISVLLIISGRQAPRQRVQLTDESRTEIANPAQEQDLAEAIPAAAALVAETEARSEEQIPQATSALSAE